MNIINDLRNLDDWRTPAHVNHVNVPPNTRNRAGDDTEKVPSTILDSDAEKSIPIMKREDLKTKPTFYWAVAEVAEEAGMIRLQ